MRITKTVSSPVFDGYRSARVRSMFNVTEATGSSHTVDVDLPIEGQDWKIGLVVGPSGTGKTTIGQELLGGGRLHQGFEWDPAKPIIEQIGVGQDFTAVTGAEVLQPMGLRLILRALDDLSRGVVVAVPQDERLATWEPSLDQPPIFRPDLPRIGAPAGFTYVTSTLDPRAAAAGAAHQPLGEWAVDADRELLRMCQT